MAVSKKKLVFVSFITTILYSIENIINETKLLKKNTVHVGSIFYYGFANNNKKLIAKGKHKNIPSPYLSSTSDSSSNMIPHDPTFLLHNNNNNNNKSKPELQFLPDEIDLLCGIPPGGKFPKELIGKGFGRVEEDSIKDVMRIRHHLEQHKHKQEQQRQQRQQNNETSSNDNNKNKNVRLMCVVYTYSGKVKFTNAISETWGPRCDGILYASDHTSTETNHVEIPSFSVRGYKYAGLFQRVRAIMAYVYDEFLDQYDYFHFCGDDVFLIVENLKEFLGSKEVQEWESKRDHYLFAGFWMNQDISKDIIDKGKKQRQGYTPSSNEFYLGGGSGYTLSRKSLKAYAEGPLQTCKTYEESPMEDIIFGHCIHEMTSNFFYTGDVDGSHRYHQGPVYMPIRYDQMRLSLEWMDTLPIEMTGLKEGVHQQMDQSSVISNSSVAFHRYYQPYELRRMELLLYRDFEKECAPYIQ